LQKNTKIDPKLKFKIKKRGFCLIKVEDIYKLGVMKNNVTKEVAYIENFYDILFKIHNGLGGHSGENKTEYQIADRYSLFPDTVMTEYIIDKN
jgi:hypothetical protein